MGRKIMCPECNTVFDEDILKARNSENTCLVCAADLGGTSESDSQSQDTDDVFESLYFDEINDYYKSVCTFCESCNKIIFLSFEQFSIVNNEEYAVLKEGTTIVCQGCGKEHYGKKILYKKKSWYATVNTPKCPICQSVDLKKITVGSKLLAAGTLGVFALPHTSKTYECKSCRYKF